MPENTAFWGAFGHAIHACQAANSEQTGGDGIASVLQGAGTPIGSAYCASTGHTSTSAGSGS